MMKFLGVLLVLSMLLVGCEDTGSSVLDGGVVYSSEGEAYFLMNHGCTHSEVYHLVRTSTLDLDSLSSLQTPN